MKVFITVMSIAASILMIPASASAGCGVCDVKAKAKAAYEAVEGAEVVEAEVGCAGCIYDKEGVKGCKTAVKIDDKVYMVKAGTKDGELDAHKTGLCKAGKKATLTGKVVGDEFVANKIELKKEDG